MFLTPEGHGSVVTKNIEVSGSTTVVGLLGHPVSHSLSPVIHNAAFHHLGLDWVFTVFDVAPEYGALAVEACRVLGIEGLSVTMPHKAHVAATVDELSPQAEKLNAVNCVYRLGNKMVGDNTDGVGFVASLKHDVNFDSAGKSCVILGAGGAARAVVVALAEAGARSITIVNRTAETARAAVALAPEVARIGEAEAAVEADLVVNATSVGMASETDPSQISRSPIDLHLLGSGQVVADLVYHPLETRLLVGARQQGAEVVNGLGMLVHQAARAFTLWTGEDAPLEVMQTALRQHLAGPKA